MVLFVIGLVFALAAIIAGVTFFATKDAETKGGSAIVGGVCTLFALVLIFFSAVTTVGTKNVAVTTAFGKPTGHLSAGFHLKAPWEKTTELNDAIQTDTYASDEGTSATPQGGATDTCIHVRVERQATACVNVSIKWQIRPDGVDYLFQNYRDNDAITDNLVLRNLQQDLNSAFSTYDPLGVSATGKNTNPPFSDYAHKAQLRLAGADGHSGQMGKYINVQSVIVPLINYDANTQAKVNQLLQQIAATRVAQQSEQTATAQAKANRALASSVSNDPNVLTDKCLNILKESVDKGQSLQGAPSCFAGSSSAGVIVNGKK